MPDTGTRPDATSATDTWELTLPSLGADMDRGTIIQWYVAVGDAVARGDFVAMVSTEKSDIDVEAWHPGTVAEILVGIGDDIPVGTPILLMSGDEAPESPAATPAAAPAAVEPPRRPERPLRLNGPPGAAPAAASSDGLRASPLARAIAERDAVDLTRVTGTGPGGAILARDVQDTAVVPGEPPAAPPTAADTEDRASAMRRVIAERMTRANADIPQYHLELDIDLTATIDRLLVFNEGRPVSERVLPAAALLRATAEALVAVPQLNGAWIDSSFRPAEAVDIAVAISLRKGGLVTPTIVDADQKSVSEIMSELREMVTGARRGALRSSWMRDAGVTVTNLGERGADRVHGIVFPPQVALVGFGRVADRPWVVDGRLEARSVVTTSLAADHRCTDGATGSRLLTALADALDNMEMS